MGSAATSPHTATGSRGRRLGDFGDEVQHGGVERVGERRDPGVPALGGQRVLGQVVGADADEVEVRQGRLDLAARAGHLDHDADPKPGRQISGGAPVLDGGLGEHRPRGAQLVDGRDHREHHAHRVLASRLAPRARAARCRCRAFEAEPQPAQAEERVVLGRQRR